MIGKISARALLSLTCLLLYAASTPARSNIRGLPKGAVVVETRRIVSPGHPNRTLVLWMLNPKKNPSGYAPDDIYPCPDQTRGSYYSGPTRVSLLNSAANSVINTVIVKEDAEDSFDLPYAIRKGYYYRVAPLTKGGVEARPTIMWLKDYNGDGKPLEFVLFDAQACMGLETTLIGYSEKQDRVIQYPIHLEVNEGAKASTSDIVLRHTSDGFWADYLFHQKPVRPGFWKYEIDYRGRAGSLDKWEVRYNPAKEQFEGKLTILPGE
jgi:hypothetical protein